MSIFCASCGTKLTAGDAFCPNCGAKADVQAQQAPPAQQAAAYAPVPPKKKKTGLIIGIIAGVVAIGAAVLVLFLTGVFGGTGDISDIRGRWFSEKDSVAFNDNGTVLIVTESEEIDADFTYDAKTGKGVIKSPVAGTSDVSFTFDGKTIEMKGKTYFRSKDDAMAAVSTPEPTPEPTPELTPVPTPEPDVPTPAPDTTMLESQIVGFWQLTEATAMGMTSDLLSQGLAFVFGEDGSAKSYQSFEESTAGTWAASGGDSVDLTDDTGEVITVESIVFAPDGASFEAEVLFEGIPGEMTFVKTDEATFLAGAAPDSSALLGMWYNQLMRGVTLEFMEDGSAVVVNQFGRHDGTYTFDAATGEGLTTFDGGGFDFVLSGDALTSGGDNWLRTPLPFPEKPPVPAADTTYTSDEDVTALLVGIEWLYAFYQDASGQEEYDVPEYAAQYNDTGEFDERYDGEDLAGLWYVQNGVLYLNYSNGDYYNWPVYIEYRADIASYVLYMEAMDENKNPMGEYLVFSDYQP